MLVVARYWTAHFEWSVHKKEALKHGLSAKVVEAIAARRRPPFENQPERLVYEIATSILETRSVPGPLYQEGVRLLGERGLVELVGVIGYYTLVSMTLVTFEIGLPESLQPEFPDK